MSDKTPHFTGLADLMVQNMDKISDKSKFAKWCYDTYNSGICKIYGKNCLAYRDPRYHRGRYM